MSIDDLPQPELLSLTRAATELSSASQPITARALYARIRRGTLYAVHNRGHWYIPRSELNRLARQAKQPRRETSFPLFSAPEINEPFANLSLAKRGRAALGAQAFLRGTIRARLRRMYPNLSPREITFKYFEEIERDGRKQCKSSNSDVLLVI
jgi:hypothetical protein